MKPGISSRRGGAFTLIELLIVVAIIAILAAIAVPNFLNAQTRSKVSRAHSDLRTLSLGLNSYFVDYHRLPAPAGPDNSLIDPVARRSLLGTLTTPVAYLSSVFADPFVRNPDDQRLQSYYYLNLTNVTGISGAAVSINKYMLGSRGPDSQDNVTDVISDLAVRQISMIQASGIYDPTNGTISEGDLIRTSCSTLGGIY